MTKNTHKFLLVFLIGNIIFSAGCILSSPVNISPKNPLELSDLDSWSIIINEGEGIFYPYFEINNNSLYVFGQVYMQYKSKYYLYIAKYSVSGVLQWDISINQNSSVFLSYIFDADGNLIISIESYSQGISLIKISASGLILFSIKIPFEESCQDPVIKLGENNSILMVSQSFYSAMLYILKLDINGAILWNKSLNVRYYSYPWFLISNSAIYVTFFDNSNIFYLAKLNGTGDLIWKINLNEYDYSHNFFVDFNETLYLLCGIDNLSVLKVNKSGDLEKELILNDMWRDYAWYLNDKIILTNGSVLFSYDLNLDNCWNFTMTDYIIPHFYRYIELTHDSQSNIFIIQHTNFEDISILKINSKGEFLSEVKWGSLLINEIPRKILTDLEDNIYFVCVCEYLDVWKIKHDYAVLVKNPVNGGGPPLPVRKLDLNDYLLFGFVGVTLVISPIKLISLLKKRKLRS